MSAIWGAINLQGNQIDQKTKELMKSSFSDCAIDRYEEKEIGGVYFGCGIQYITPEAEYEQLPYEGNGTLFTADVILDNRDELLGKIECDHEDNRVVSDGEILFKFYTKFGKDGLNDILGSYSFVIYNNITKSIELITDSVGSRALYYCLNNNILYFSNLMKAIKSVCNNSYNNRWMGLFIAGKNLGMYKDETSTQFKNIFYVPNASRISITANAIITKEKYWRPLKNCNELHFKNDNDCKEAFNRLFDDCVKCLLRSQAKTAVLLSSGLDSTAIACFAAPYLKEKGDSLYSYTSIPLSEYKEDENNTYYVNEKAYVLQTKDYLQNLECSFIDTNGINGWNKRQEYMKFYETPYKSIQNIVWITEAVKKAAADGNRIILSGQTGNGAFSYGSICVTMNTLFNQLKISEFIRELNILHKHGGSRKYNLTKVVKLAILRFIYHKPKESSLWENTYITKQAVKKYQLKKVLLKWERSSLTFTINDARRRMLYPIGFRQAAEFETKQSLRTGVQFRDPTRDKRLLAFCMRLPVRHFAWGITERRLVREYLADKMPLFIKTERKRGLQSADTHYRLKKDWINICAEMQQIYLRNCNSDLVNSEKALDMINRLKDGYQKEDEYEVIQLIYTALMLEYLSGVII